MAEHKKSLNKFKKIEIISSICSDHKGLKLETNLKAETQKNSNTWRLNNMLLNNDWVKNEIKEEIKKHLETNENEHTKTQNLRDTAKAVLRGKFTEIQAGLPKEDRKISNKQPSPIITRRTTMNKAQSKKRKEIINIRAALNVIETKRTIQRINKSRSWFFKKIKRTDKPLTRFIRK